MTHASETPGKRPLTGGKVAAMFCGGFGIIIAVNLTLAFNAVSTFPGIETKNVYVVSQAFEADRAAQDALGWEVETTLNADTLRLAVTDAEGPVQPRIVSATFGRATTVADDVVPEFSWDGTAWVAPIAAGRGNWNLRLEMEAADGTAFRRRIPLRVTP
ncbi:FixH family protein [Jannaschia seohaensis]|uniref:Nitrogen fixation protein FixH n=1 Tax=Jannaschia seohaensis TaxID=475081 RepID=A0A2Y9A3C4_9RHOB|nr:FixH family protein [Jannaschia seohaensis]PWJ22457.1 nitrogen fixation protein FixH [Jannaschia seohaensis]SSA38735.1 Nitrogen fixation protein FixH [Jannaschia seohaensis]